jgi:hypothetical protein
MNTEFRIVLLLLISLIHAGWILDIELELAPAPARVVKTTGGMGAGDRCDSTFQPDESQSLPKGKSWSSA